MKAAAVNNVIEGFLRPQPTSESGKKDNVTWRKKKRFRV